LHADGVAAEVGWSFMSQDVTGPAASVAFPAQLQDVLQQSPRGVEIQYLAVQNLSTVK
jgi:hypothetical protein